MFTHDPATIRPAAECISTGVPLGAAPWHCRRPEALIAALAQFRNAAPHVRDLADRYLRLLPRRVLCSQNLRTSCPSPYSTELPIDVAADCPWISFDSETRRNVLAFDLDHDDGLDLVAELPAPIRPHLVIDPYSGRSHGFIVLRTPVSTAPGASRKAQAFADYAQELMAAALRATPLRHRALVKNPLGSVGALLGPRLRRTPQPLVPAMWDAWQAADAGLVWHTIPGADPVELSDIIAALAGADDVDRQRPMRRTFTRRRGEPSALGRNCSLFDQVRWWAYDRDEQDGGAILAEAERINATFAAPLPASEVAATARSIAKFMHARFRPRPGPGPGRGRDREAGADLPPEARKALAGQQTAALRATKTVAQISAAMERMQRDGKRITQAAVAAEAGVSLRTVKDRWDNLHQPQVMVQDAAYQVMGPAPEPPPQSEGTSSPPTSTVDARSRLPGDRLGWRGRQKVTPRALGQASRRRHGGGRETAGRLPGGWRAPRGDDAARGPPSTWRRRPVGLFSTMASSLAMSRLT